MTSKRMLAFNSASGVVLFVTSIVVTFLLSPVVVRELGNRDYGIWDIILSFLGYLRILEVGIGPALIRSIALHHARGSSRDVQVYFNTGVVSLATAGALCLGLFLLLSLAPDIVLNVEEDAPPLLGTVFLLAGANLAVQLTALPFTACLFALQKHYIINSIRTVLAITLGILWYWALTSWNAPGLVSVSAILLATTVLEHALFAVIVLAVEKDVRLAPALFSWACLRELYTFGLKSFLTMVGGRLRRQSLPIVIAHTSGLGQVVFFALPMRLIDYARGFPATIREPLLPYFSALAGSEDPTAIRRTWFEVSRVLQFIVLWIPVAIYFLGSPFLYRWMGPSYAEECFWVVRIVSAGLFLELIASMAPSVLVSLNRHGRAGLWNIVWSLVAVTIAIPLTTRLGVDGAAIAYAATSAGLAFTTLALAGRALEFSIGEHVRRTFIGFLIPLATSVAVFHVLGLVASPLTYPLILLHLLAGCIAYAGTAWPLSLNTAERRVIRSRVTVAWRSIASFIRPRAS